MPRGGKRPGGGGAQPGAGRPAVDLRSLDISEVGLEFGEPVEYTAEIIITKCGGCGAVGWEPYHVRVSPIEPLPQPNGNGECWPTLATVQMPGRVAKHGKGCPNH